MEKKKTFKRRLIAVLLTLVIAVFAGLGYVGNYLVNYAIGRSGDGGNRQVSLEVDKGAQNAVADEKEQNRQAQKELTRQFKQDVPEQAVSITSADGLKLNGGYFENADSHKWVIAVHGYRGNHTHMNDFAQRYYAQGYQVLSPDLRGCGDSEGSYVGMGWPDRLDICQWIDWVISQDPQAQIVLHGISMGGATVMMTSGEDLPENVVCIVDDCGYTSVWDIFASELQLRFHLPTFPVLNVASVVSSVKAGYGFKNASSLNQVSKCQLPMLLIHGDQDDFVPFWMEDALYQAKPGDDKQKVVAEGAGHGNAKDVMGESYWTYVFDFVNKYM